ncbi:MAG: hypothetical protein ABSF59_20180 [Candidatus Sulfotelmatobacter sp.]|jgi:hypothetical protein
MGMIKLVVGFLAIVAVVVGIFQVAPPMMANYSFQDDLKNIAMVSGGSSTKTDDDIRTDILRKAKEHDLPITEKQVTVTRISTPGNNAVYVAADYSVTINMPFYPFDMHFTPSSGNRGF